MPKSFTKKYFVGVDGVNDLLHDTQITAKLFWKMVADSEAIYKESLEQQIESPDYVLEKSEFEQDMGTYTIYKTMYLNGCARVWYTRYVCKPGYRFIHK